MTEKVQVAARRYYPGVELGRGRHLPGWSTEQVLRLSRKSFKKLWRRSGGQPPSHLSAEGWLFYSPLAASTVVNLLFRQLHNFHLLRVISCYRAPDEVTIIVTKACANKHEEEQIGIHFNSRKKINHQSIYIA